MRYNQKIMLIEPEFSISKSNELAVSNYDTKLTLVQLKLVYYSIYLLQHTECSEFSKSEFESFMDYSNLNSSALEKHIALLNTTNVIFSEEKVIKLYKDISYDKGVIRFEFAEDMLEHVFDLKSNFILIPAFISKSFTNIYSWKLYEFLRAHYGFHNKYYEVEELLTIFNVAGNDAYKKNISMFSTRVLNPAVAEVNNHTELIVAIEMRKYKRKILGINLEWSGGRFENLITGNQKAELMNYINTFSYDMGFSSALPKDLQIEMKNLSKNIVLLNEKITKGLLQNDYQIAKETLVRTTEKSKKIINRSNIRNIDEYKISVDDLWI